MGAWGTGAFENDEAMDLMGELLEMTGDNEEILNALRLIFKQTETEGYLEAPEYDRAVAAGHITAVMHGEPSGKFPDELQAWLEERQVTFTKPDVELALQAIRRVSSNSKLKDLWEETENYEEWSTGMAKLKERLARLAGRDG